MQNKPQWDTTHPPGCDSPKREIVASAAEDAEKPKPPYVTSGKVEGEGTATLENHLEALKTFKHRITRWQQFYFFLSTERDENVCPYRNLNVNIHRVSQVEVTQC